MVRDGSAALRRAVFAALACASGVLVVVACGSSSEATSSGAPQPDAAGTEDVAKPAVDASEASTDPGPDGGCASTFGNGLTEGFGRLDGIVWAVQKPSDTACTFPNRDHVIVQVLMKGAVYRMVVNVESDRGGDAKIRVVTLPKALPAPPFEEGWHTGIPMDYANVLGVHSGDAGFAALTLTEAVTKIAAEVKVGDPIAVYGTSGPGRPESTHLIHRNKDGDNVDGALVIAPSSSSPKFMLFHFADQTF